MKTLYLFISNLDACVSCPCLIAPTSTIEVMDRNESGHPHLVSHFRGKSFRFSPLCDVNYRGVCVCVLFVRLWKFSFILSLLFNQEWILLDIFQHLVGLHGFY